MTIPSKMEIALDTLGTIADRQSTVPPELADVLKSHGRNQLAISFTENAGKHGSFLHSFFLITSAEAEKFLESNNPDEGLAMLIAERAENLPTDDVE